MSFVPSHKHLFLPLLQICVLGAKLKTFWISPPRAHPLCSIDLLSHLNTEFNIQVCKCNINKMAYSAEPKGLFSWELL